MSRARASSDVFQAVADPTRRAILDRLRRGGAPVGELASGFEMSRPAVSKHLRVLREAALVRERKDGRQRIYEITPAPLEDVARWAEAYRAFWSTSLESLKKHVEARVKKESPKRERSPTSARGRSTRRSRSERRWTSSSMR